MEKEFPLISTLQPISLQANNKPLQVVCNYRPLPVDLVSVVGRYCNRHYIHAVKD